jgi:hypothetical protein
MAINYSKKKERRIAIIDKKFQKTGKVEAEGPTSLDWLEICPDIPTAQYEFIWRNLC